MDKNKEIVYLNVGGTKFATSKQTLISVENTFFTALLSHDENGDLIPALKDYEGYFFIDRDPEPFRIILNYLRSGQLNVDNVDLDTLLHEAEFYGIVPLIRRLKFCHNLLNKTECSGSLLFQGIIKFDEEIDNPEYRLLGDTRDSTELRSNPSPGTSSPNKRLVVQIVTDNYIVSVGYTYQIRFYKFSDSHGFRLLFEPYDLEHEIDTVAFYRQTQADGFTLFIGIYFKELKRIQLWCLLFNKDSLTYQKSITSNFSLRESEVNALFFIGPHLVALSYASGLIGVSHAHNGQWLIQNLTEESDSHISISAYDKVGCDFLLLATNNGSIYLIDMNKFPLRIKVDEERIFLRTIASARTEALTNFSFHQDGGLLINLLYKDPNKKMITALSCYLITKSKNQPRKWYGAVTKTF